MRLLLLYLASMLGQSAIAFPPRLLTTPLAHTYDLPNTYYVRFDSREYGGCQGHKAKVLQSYSEALDAAWATWEALDTINIRTGAGPDQVLPPQPERKRIIDAFTAMYGVTDSNDMGLDDASGKKVSDFLQAILEEHSAGTTPRFHLMCSDKWLEWYAADAKDPTDLSRKVQDTVVKAWNKVHPNKQAKGIYYARYTTTLQPANKFFWWEDAPVKSKTPLCTGRTLIPMQGPVLYEALDGVLTFCPELLKKKTWSIDTKGGEEAVKIKQGTSIMKSDETIAQIWLYNWGLEIPQRYGKLDQKLGGDVVGWDDAHNLAKKSTELALKSTENHSLFMLAMYWKDWCWRSEGKAIEFKNGRGGAGTC